MSNHSILRFIGQLLFTIRTRMFADTSTALSTSSTDFKVKKIRGHQCKSASRKKLLIPLLILTAFLLSSCALGTSEIIATPVSVQTNPEANSEIPSPTPSHAPSATPLPTETATPLPTLTYTPTPVPTVVITASVWITEPQVAALTYHQFKPNWSETNDYDYLKLRYEDVWTHFQTLYDAGFSLVSLEDWVSGKIDVPYGRRPVIITMDDLFFNNQLTLLEDGSPSPETGIGAMWAFSQEHPDFGFRLALFADLGDKLYANPDYPDWEEKLAQAVAWCLENGAIIYNHTYQHTSLDLTKPGDIQGVFAKNDEYLRELLHMIERDDLIPELGNILALPYSRWPATPLGIEKLLAYTTPEGLPIQAIVEADYIYRPNFIPAPFSENFDALHIPRINAQKIAIDYLVENRDQFPAADRCVLTGLDPELADDPGYLEAQIHNQIDSGSCPVGTYIIGEHIFRLGTPAGDQPES